MKANPLKIEGALSDVISHDVSPLEVNTDARAVARLGWLIVLLGVGGFFLWALFAPLDKGVPLSGTVAKESNRKAIQFLTGGMVQDILVKDGDEVKAGQVLVRMNAISAQSQADMARSQYLQSRAMEARLTAERDGLHEIRFPAELRPARHDARIDEIVNVQKQVFMARQAAVQNEAGAMEESIAGLKIQIKTLEDARENKKAQLVFLKEQLDGMRELAKDGYVARNRLLDTERSYMQMSGAMADDGGQIGRLHSQVAETTMRRAQRQQEYQKEVRGMLADAQKDAASLGARLTALDFDLASTEVKAPVDGAVMGLAVFTKGGVVNPGFRMMDIVPTNDPLVVEGQLPVNLIDKMQTGLKVDLIFAAFNANRTPHIPGVVTQVSADRSVDEHTGTPYYKVRVSVTPEGVKLIAQHKLTIQPGMPVELFVITGERTMMNYLMKPILDRSKSSLNEE